MEWARYRECVRKVRWRKHVRGLAVRATTFWRRVCDSSCETRPRLPHGFPSGRQLGERGVGYLQKPFTVVELTAELRRVIDEMK